MFIFFRPELYTMAPKGTKKIKVPDLPPGEEIVISGKLNYNIFFNGVNFLSIL